MTQKQRTSEKPQATWHELWWKSMKSLPEANAKDSISLITPNTSAFLCVTSVRHVTNMKPHKKIPKISKIRGSESIYQAPRDRVAFHTGCIAGAVSKLFQKNGASTVLHLIVGDQHLHRVTGVRAGSLCLPWLTLMVYTWKLWKIPGKIQHRMGSNKLK